MRKSPKNNVERGRLPGSPPGANYGQFQLANARGERMTIQASQGGGWDHVSVSFPDRCPSWEEMSFVKFAFFRDEEPAMQLHVPAERHVNHHKFCLHLWRPQTPQERSQVINAPGDDGPEFDTPPHGIPLPPLEMVGPRRPTQPGPMATVDVAISAPDSPAEPAA